jgi:formylglycine-generating enzyme required for sulfatase activity
MHGNVSELTADWYQATYPTGNPVVDPTGPTSGSIRLFRGGSWLDDGPSLRSSERDLASVSTFREGDFGFRLALKKVN